jgi:hypothetical protein
MHGLNEALQRSGVAEEQLPKATRSVKQSRCVSDDPFHRAQCAAVSVHRGRCLARLPRQGSVMQETLKIDKQKQEL